MTVISRDEIILCALAQRPLAGDSGTPKFLGVEIPSEVGRISVIASRAVVKLISKDLSEENDYFALVYILSRKLHLCFVYWALRLFHSALLSNTLKNFVNVHRFHASFKHETTQLLLGAFFLRT